MTTMTSSITATVLLLLLTRSNAQLPTISPTIAITTPPTASPTSSPTVSPTITPLECADDDQRDYRGFVSATKSGLTCQKWTEQSPQSHTRTPANFPNAGLGDHNYCRNPDLEIAAWCYTTSPTGPRRELCSVPPCTPTSSPSSMPSSEPSASPSSSPSNVPSDTPSSAPSDVPSSLPSCTPSSTPSEEPSTNPSMSHQPSTSHRPTYGKSSGKSSRSSGKGGSFSSGKGSKSSSGKGKGGTQCGPTTRSAKASSAYASGKGKGEAKILRTSIFEREGTTGDDASETPAPAPVPASQPLPVTSLPAGSMVLSRSNSLIASEIQTMASSSSSGLAVGTVIQLISTIAVICCIVSFVM